jgi:hypothetical protein
MPQALIAKLIGVLALCLACMWLGYEWRDREAETQLAHLQAQHAEARAAQSLDLAAAEKQHREREQRREDLIRETLNAAHTKLIQAQRDAADAHGASYRLQRRVSALIAARAADPSASCPAARAGPPADAPGDLLADLFSRIDAAAGELGEYADRARIAGEACERAFDAVSR